MNIQALLDNLIFLTLLVVTLTYWANLIYSNFRFLGQIGFYCNLCANSLIFVLLGLRWLDFGYFPLSNLYESLMFLAWGITLISLIAEKQFKLTLVGVVTSPISLFISGFASLSLPENMQTPSPLVPALKSNWLMMHVTVMMFSYASLIIGSLLGIFFLVLSYGNKGNINIQGNSNGISDAKPNIAFYTTADDFSNSAILTNTAKPDNKLTERLTLLESIDNLSYRTISFGFPMLTIGIIAGAVWANEAWGTYWSWDPKETWALITWLVFASYLHSRITKSWRGEKPAIIASIGFVVVWICYLGVNFLGKGLHTYGQIL